MIFNAESTMHIKQDDIIFATGGMGVSMIFGSHQFQLCLFNELIS